jgi:hypothetical protein
MDNNNRGEKQQTEITRNITASAKRKTTIYIKITKRKTNDAI